MSGARISPSCIELSGDLVVVKGELCCLCKWKIDVC